MRDEQRQNGGSVMSKSPRAGWVLIAVIVAGLIGLSELVESLRLDEPLKTIGYGAVLVLASSAGVWISATFRPLKGLGRDPD
jgi:hypothetical protein